MELFDKLITPIFMYSSEVWGFHSAPAIERIHVKCCKKYLHVKTSTPNDICRSELGRVDMKTSRLLRIVKYWLKILHSPDTRNIVKIYKVLCQDVEKGKTNWAFNVKTLLYQLGFGQVWLFQTVGSLNAISVRIQTTVV